MIFWTNNLGPAVIDTNVLRPCFPILAVGLAVIDQDRGWGLFSIVEARGWVAVPVSKEGRFFDFQSEPMRKGRNTQLSSRM